MLNLNFGCEKTELSGITGRSQKEIFTKRPVTSLENQGDKESSE